MPVGKYMYATEDGQLFADYEEAAQHEREIKIREQAEALVQLFYGSDPIEDWAAMTLSADDLVDFVVLHGAALKNILA